MHEGVLGKELPSARIEEANDAIRADHLDALLVAKRIPEASALAVQLSRNTPWLVRRSVDGDRRKLAIRNARLVDERNSLGCPVEADQSFRLEQIHLRYAYGQLRTGLPARAGAVPQVVVVRVPPGTTACREDVARIVAEVLAGGRGSAGSLDTPVLRADLECNAVVERSVHPVDEALR